MNKPTDPSPAQPDQSRRRILRGMAGVPLLVTVGNASAQAVASNLACIDKNADALQAAVAEELNYNQGQGTYCAPTSSDLLQPIGDGVYSGPGGVLMEQVSPGQACVLYVDENGVPQGYNSSLGSPVTPSCYTSFV